MFITFFGLVLVSLGLLGSITLIYFLRETEENRPEIIGTKERLFWALAIDIAVFFTGTLFLMVPLFI